jgi:hypothetical protein
MPCEASAKSFVAVLAKANVVDDAAAAATNWTSWSSTLTLPPETLAPSHTPYIFSATVIITGGDNGGRPLLRRELTVYVEYDINSPQSGQPSPLGYRRAIFDGVADIRLPSVPSQHVRAYNSPATRSPPFDGPNYALRLAAADAGGWAVDVSEQQPPVSGLCRMWWDGWEAGGLVMGASVECKGWIGRDADAYPLSYEFGLRYRYAYLWLCIKRRHCKTDSRS